LTGGALVCGLLERELACILSAREGLGLEGNVNGLVEALSGAAIFSRLESIFLAVSLVIAFLFVDE
jgi:hypothetical protein